MADQIVSTAGNPIASAKSVWTSQKFRSAVAAAIGSVLAAFVSGFLAALIPKLGADQVMEIMKWTQVTVIGPFLAQILGHSYVDGKAQEAPKDPTHRPF